MSLQKLTGTQHGWKRLMQLGEQGNWLGKSTWLGRRLDSGQLGSVWFVTQLGSTRDSTRLGLTRNSARFVARLGSTPRRRLQNRRSTIVEGARRRLLCETMQRKAAGHW